MDLEWLADIPLDYPPPLDVRTESVNAEVARMVLSGEVDAVSAVDLQRAVVDVLRHHRPRRIEMDLADVTFLDAGGTKVLVLCQADARQVDCWIRLANVQPAVYLVLHLTGLVEHFGVPRERPQPEPIGGVRLSTAPVITEMRATERSTSAAPR